MMGHRSITITMKNRRRKGRNGDCGAVARRLPMRSDREKGPRLDVIDDCEDDARDAQDEQSGIQRLCLTHFDLASQFGRTSDVDPVDGEGERGVEDDEPKGDERDSDVVVVPHGSSHGHVAVDEGEEEVEEEENVRQFDDGDKESTDGFVGPEIVDDLVDGHQQRQNVADDKRQEEDVARLLVQFLLPVAEAEGDVEIQWQTHCTADAVEPKVVRVHLQRVFTYYSTSSAAVAVIRRPRVVHDVNVPVEYVAVVISLVMIEIICHFTN